jgi:mannose-6-phosphate isomerase
LDAHRDLSVQVHPNDQQAARQTPPDLGKTEAWVVLDALPGSRLYAGLKSGVDRESLARAVAQGDTQRCLHCIEPRPGDCIFVPAGTLHALGAGLLVAEIQQSSDTTFRLFDWNRVDTDGRRRALHVEQALETIDYQRGPVSPQTPQPTDLAHVQRLVDCDKFVLDRWHFDAPAPLATSTGGFHLLAVLAGAVHVSGDPSEQPLMTGQTLLVPASVAQHTQLHPRGAATMLDIFVR